MSIICEPETGGKASTGYHNTGNPMLSETAYSKGAYLCLAVAVGGGGRAVARAAGGRWSGSQGETGGSGCPSPNASAASRAADWRHCRGGLSVGSALLDAFVKWQRCPSFRGLASLSHVVQRLFGHAMWTFPVCSGGSFRTIGCKRGYAAPAFDQRKKDSRCRKSFVRIW